MNTTNLQKKIILYAPNGAIQVSKIKEGLMFRIKPKKVKKAGIKRGPFVFPLQKRTLRWIVVESQIVATMASFLWWEEG
jgi:hypothetical protein